MDVEAYVEGLAQKAKGASVVMAQATDEQRNGALRAMACGLREHADEILKANEADVEAARAAGTSESLIDRLALDPARVEDMAQALEDLAALPDPVGQIQEERTLYNGIQLRRVSVPLGVVAVVYEARPNVTADAAGICLKSGNAVILRGGSLAAGSTKAISAVLAQAAQDAGLPEGAIVNVDVRDRSAADCLMRLHGLVDVLVPRGGAGLIRHCVECAKVPVIETGTGNCHVYVHAAADLDMAQRIILNAKCRRLGVCNAAETLLVDAAVAADFLPATLAALRQRGITIHGCAATCAIAAEAGVPCVAATKADWETEYLSADLAVRVVEGLEAALEHIATYSTKHSEAIVTADDQAAQEFLRRVDAAAVYVNASTSFTDGGQFGLGAEIGISTQKLHVRGPFALQGLTSYKYQLIGDGQVRQ